MRMVRPAIAHDGHAVLQRQPGGQDCAPRPQSASLRTSFSDQGSPIWRILLAAMLPSRNASTYSLLWICMVQRDMCLLAKPCGSNDPLTYSAAAAAYQAQCVGVRVPACQPHHQNVPLTAISLFLQRKSMMAWRDDRQQAAGSIWEITWAQSRRLHSLVTAVSQKADDLSAWETCAACVTL